MEACPPDKGLHRAWVVEASLKKGTRHTYKKRTFYIDEEKNTFIIDREKPIKDFSISALRRAGRR